MHTSFRQILPQTALKILAGQKPACGFLPTLQQNYARKSAHISYEDRFLLNSIKSCALGGNSDNAVFGRSLTPEAVNAFTKRRITFKGNLSVSGIDDNKYLFVTAASYICKRIFVLFGIYKLYLALTEKRLVGLPYSISLFISCHREFSSAISAAAVGLSALSSCLMYSASLGAELKPAFVVLSHCMGEREPVLP